MEQAGANAAVDAEATKTQTLQGRGGGMGGCAGLLLRGDRTSPYFYAQVGTTRPGLQPRESYRRDDREATERRKPRAPDARKWSNAWGRRHGASGRDTSGGAWGWPRRERATRQPSGMHGPVSPPLQRTVHFSLFPAIRRRRKGICDGKKGWEAFRPPVHEAGATSSLLCRF